MTDHPLVPDLDLTVHFVLNDFGDRGCAYIETDPQQADFDTIVTNVIAGVYTAPARVVAVNVAGGVACDVSVAVAREAWRRTAGRERHEALCRFIDRHMVLPRVIA